MTRIYVHCDGGRLECLDVSETSVFGDLKKSLGCDVASGLFLSRFRTPIADSSLVSSYLDGKNDFYFEGKHSSSSSSNQRSDIGEKLKLEVKSTLQKPILKSLTRYSWEDKDNSRVVVRLPFAGAKEKLKESDVECIFDVRSFTVRVLAERADGWQFSCPRTHASIDPSKCSFRITKDDVVLSLGKVVQEGWYDLFKKKSIGDTDAL